MNTIPVSAPIKVKVKDFNGVGLVFVPCTDLPEIKMADKKSEASENKTHMSEKCR